MAELVVSAATGALKPLLEKLHDVLGEEFRRFKGVRGEIKSLTKELEAMHAYLLKMSEVEDPDVQDEDCMKEVRELSYDMEDSLDEFLLRVDDKANSNSPDGLIVNKLKNIIITKPKTRYKIAKAIEDLKIQVKEMGERNVRYKAYETVSKTSNCEVDQRALAMFQNASELVGLDGPKNELIIELSTKKNKSVRLQPTKVVSLVGCGGLGKTTLANQVYEALKGDFECHAFVSVSRDPIIKHVLKNILCQVDNTPHHNIQAWNMQTLIVNITCFLKDKRYLIVIDDLWTKAAWATINCALYKNDKDSKIITTTRMYDVAKACCSSDGDFVYEVKPLGPADSKRLFFVRLFGSEDKCHAHLTRISNKILEKCDGLPLAIISVSSLLASKGLTEDEWGRVHNSMGRGLEKHPDVASMMQILSLSFFDLPHYLKTCLLYLSIFPENSVVDKKRLVRRWIAEGFIPKEQGRSLYELGERCFNELINRSLIQARDINMYGEVTACQVHDTILDFIVSKSDGENFVTVFGDGYELPVSDSKVRRLSIHASSKERAFTETRLDFSHVRSVTMFGYYVELTFRTKFSFLRVLDLQGCRQMQGSHLTGIGDLLQLKYLSIHETGVRELPEQIWKVKSLETLVLKKSKVKNLPASIAQLQRLICLAVDEGVKLPDGIERMTTLEDLDCVDIFKQSTNFPQQLGQLKGLRNVCLYLSSNNCSEGTRYKEYLGYIASSLCKLGHLISLSIDVDPESTDVFSLDSGGDVPLPASPNLWKLEIKGHFISKVPNWVRSLDNLRCLTLYVREFEVEDIMAIGRLPALVFLRLIAHESFQGRRVTIGGADGFQSLRHFDYGCSIPITFEAGAMPEIKKLTLLFSLFKTTIQLGRNEDFLFRFGIQHLTSLDSVYCLLYLEAMVEWITEKTTQVAHRSCEQVKATVSEMEAIVEQMFKSENRMETAARAHLKCPELIIRRTTHWRIRSEYFIADSLFSRVTGNYYERSMLRDIKGKVKERIRNCPLKGKGDCQCQGLPEIKAQLATSSFIVSPWVRNYK